MFVVFPRKRADVQRARSELCARGSRRPPTKANRGSFAAKTCVTGHEKVCWALLPSGCPKSGADGFSRLVWPQEDSGSCVLHLTPPLSGLATFLLSQNDGTPPPPDTDYGSWQHEKGLSSPRIPLGTRGSPRAGHGVLASSLRPGLSWFQFGDRFLCKISRT